ncbi:MAG: hypothetical protein NTV29_16215 [Planctomycetota bacterium]|nr:hypothetical protein [Planctomycetota bacterium]
MARHSFIRRFAKNNFLMTLVSGAAAVLSANDSACGQSIHWPRQDLAIPFELSSVGNPPAYLELEVSEDTGKTWQSVAKADPKQRQFQFQTQRDGTYWFRVKSLDLGGQVIDPPGEPMHIVIDSTKPTGQLLIDLDRKGDLQAEFRIVESSLDHNSIRLEYQTELDSAWKEISCTTEKGTQEHEWIGSASWSIPHQTTQLVVKLSGRDQAGNTFDVTRMPRLPKTALGLSGSMKLASTRQDGLPATDKPPTKPSTTSLIGSGLAKPTLSLPTLPSGLNLAPAGPAKAFPTQNIPAQPKPAPPPMFTSTGLPVRSIESIPASTLNNTAQVAQASDAKGTEISRLPSLNPPLANPSNLQANTLHSSSKSFELDYAIVNDPGAPIASVELWGTLDQGKTWERWGIDSDRESPFDIEVESEGFFGFRMVIVGSNGLASRRPLPGDAADAWIQVDSSVPRARILSALAGKGSDAGSLVVEYQALDEHFIDRPISLYYAEAPQGPWIPITQGAKNQGRFAWTAESHLPEKVYLRLHATDAAGNVGEHILDLPVDVQNAAPRGKIQGFRPR